MKKTILQQSKALFRSFFHSKKIKSIATLNSYAYAVAAGIKKYFGGEITGHKITDLVEHKTAVKLLNDLQNQGVSQTILDKTRLGLQFFPKVQNIDRVRSIPNAGVRYPKSRIYTDKQLEIVSSRLSDRNAFSVKLCAAAGLSVHELHTIKRIDEQMPTRAVDYKRTQAAFKGMENYERYSVVGKGGLCREVRLAPELARELEAHRLEKSIEMKDRGITYKNVRYDLAAGNSLSQAFGDASRRAFGWSRGIHGLRHCYAQKRYQKLIYMGSVRLEAQTAVSQELGHFRPDITTYLR